MPVFSLRLMCRLIVLGVQAAVVAPAFGQTAQWSPTRTTSRPTDSAIRIPTDAELPPWQRNPNSNISAMQPTAIRTVQGESPIARSPQSSGPTSARLAYDVPLQPGEQLVGQPTYTEQGSPAAMQRRPNSASYGRVKTVAGERAPTVAQREILPTPGYTGNSSYSQSTPHYHGDVVHEGGTDLDPNFDFENGGGMYDDGMYDGGMNGSCTTCVDGNCSGGCSSCMGNCGGMSSDPWSNPTPCPECGGCGFHRLGCFRVARCIHNCVGHLFNEWSIFAGPQGFKGPMDQGGNGNFGFNEGINAAGALIPYPRAGLGYQAGVRWTQSDLSGTPFGSSERGQVFYTFGVFHRAYRNFGLQGGVVYDGLQDNYYTNVHVGQIRTEASWLNGYGHEFGFLGTFGVGSDSLNPAVFPPATFPTQKISPTNQYSMFYRRTTSYGGQGRIWVGASSQSLLLTGADFRVPLSNRFDFVGGFNYIIPQHGNTNNGQVDESFGLAMNLVWYFGRLPQGIHNTPYRALFNVADNTTMMMKTP